MKLLFTVVFLFTIIFQSTSQNTDNFGDNHPNVHKILVKEVLQTTSYTYLNGEDNGKLQWLAVPKMVANVGDIYYYQGGMDMGKFTSKELDRTFESIIFLNGVISPDVVEGGKTVLNQSTQKTDLAEKKLDVKITPAAGGITIAELFSNKEKYAGKVVKIKGKVTKYNSKIMGKNWIHLQDGTGSSEGFDFTATTAEEVNVDDIITIEGIITLNKDFGSGYFYEIIMENGKLIQ